jgi:hypothetical protein
MSKLIQIIIALALTILFTSCEEVVKVDLKTSQERLLIEAIIEWDKGSVGNNQSIRLQRTSPFEEVGIVPATGAIVSITHENGTNVSFIETAAGIYETSLFEPAFDVTYTLTVTFEDETYVATSTFQPVPVIDSLTQSTENGFSDEDPEVNIFFTDPEGIENFYEISFNQFRLIDGELSLVDYSIYLYDDKFEDGSQLTDYYEYDNIRPGDLFQVSLKAISKRYNNYLTLLDSQADGGIGPFASPPVNVKGNIVNQTNAENYPYGFFTMSENVHGEYLFE